MCQVQGVCVSISLSPNVKKNIGWAFAYVVTVPSEDYNVRLHMGDAGFRSLAYMLVMNRSACNSQQQTDVLLQMLHCSANKFTEGRPVLARSDSIESRSVDRPARSFNQT